MKFWSGNNAFMKKNIIIIFLSLFCFIAGFVSPLIFQFYADINNPYELFSMGEVSHCEKNFIKSLDLPNDNKLQSGDYILEVWLPNRPLEKTKLKLPFKNGQFDFPYMKKPQRGNMKNSAKIEFPLVSWDVEGRFYDAGIQYIGVVQGNMMWGQVYGYNQEPSGTIGFWKLYPDKNSKQLNKHQKMPFLWQKMMREPEKTWKEATRKGYVDINELVEKGYSMGSHYDGDAPFYTAMFIFEIENDPHGIIKEMINSKIQKRKIFGICLAGELGDKRFYNDIKACLNDKTEMEGYFRETISDNAAYALSKMHSRDDLLSPDMASHVAQWLKDARKIKTPYVFQTNKDTE
jgi:hypothetical protein